MLALIAEWITHATYAGYRAVGLPKWAAVAIMVVPVAAYLAYVIFGD